MVQVQTWLNQNYSNKDQATYIEVKNQGLTGELIIQNFPNLEKIDCRNNKDLTSIELNNLPSLKHFQANNCQIENIIVINCPNLTYFNVGNNLLTKTDFLTSLNPQNLTHLSIHSNNFSKQKLDCLNQFTNLEELYLDNSNEENFDQRIYNHFYGSLEPLRNLKKLKWLSIAKTDLDNGLEYLPASVKKIGCKKDWGSDNDSNCIKITRELEKASQASLVTEKLIQEEENEPITLRGKATWYRLAPWRQAWNLLGEEEFKKQISQQSAQTWLNKCYPKETNNELEKRENITFLNLNNKNLAGHLDLREFVNLESLSCLGNKLSNLGLSNCNNLIKINCSGNKFANADFLQEIPNKEKLEILRINKNEELKENLNFLTLFTGLKDLNIEDCPLVGSLEPLKDMKKLKKIFISRTHISKGLEYLPNSCRELYCDYDYQYKSIKIADELSKFSEDRHYDIPKWREDKQNSLAALVIPSERLFVIRSNIKKFVNKWGKQVEDNWYEKNEKRLINYVNTWRKKPEIAGNKTALGKLKHPDGFSKQWWLTTGFQWTNRATSVVGGSLLLVGTSQNNDQYTEVGGIIAITAPFIETITSYINDKVYETKQKKWEEFINDTENLLDNYHELLGILKKIKISKLGEINQALNDLRSKTKAFLGKYDEEDKNGVIDINELTSLEARKKFAEDLNKENEGQVSQLGKIIQSMIQLEEELIKYRQGNLVEENDGEEKGKLANRVEATETDNLILQVETPSKGSS